jgi:hypothetical protein
VVVVRLPAGLGGLCPPLGCFAVELEMRMVGDK